MKCNFCGKEASHRYSANSTTCICENCIKIIYENRITTEIDRENQYSNALFIAFFSNLPRLNFLFYAILCDDVLARYRKEKFYDVKIEIGWKWLDNLIKEYCDAPVDKKKYILKKTYGEYLHKIHCISIRDVNFYDELKRVNQKMISAKETFKNSLNLSL